MQSPFLNPGEEEKSRQTKGLEMCVGEERLGFCCCNKQPPRSWLFSHSKC